jgi:hypothetical protein
MIAWEESLEVAVKKAANEKKLVLVDFYNPQ